MRLSHNVDKVLGGKSVEECADACVKESLFPCRSFDYDKTGSTCHLSRASSDNASLIPGKGFDHYQTSEFTTNLTFLWAILHQNTNFLVTKCEGRTREF